jgi:plastocyanin
MKATFRSRRRGAGGPRFRLIRIGLLGLMTATAAPAGSIVGTIRALPPGPGAEPAQAAQAYASRRYKYVEKIDYEQLRDFVVYIDQPTSEFRPGELAQQTVKTTQKDANFEPHVLPVVVGTAVRWPNEDDIFHNVFSMSDAKEFDLGYYKKEKVPEVQFDRVGRVDVFCAIHPRMHCIILVVPNPFFALADEKGRFEIRNVPAGTYRLKGWHERMPSRTREVVVPATGEVRVELTLGFGELPKY